MRWAKLALSRRLLSAVTIWRREGRRRSRRSVGEGTAICSTDSGRGTTMPRRRPSPGGRRTSEARGRARVSSGARVRACCSNGCLCPRERFFVRKELRNASEGRKKGKEGNDNGGERGDREGEGGEGRAVEEGCPECRSEICFPCHAKILFCEYF